MLSAAIASLIIKHVHVLLGICTALLNISYRTCFMGENSSHLSSSGINLSAVHKHRWLFRPPDSINGLYR